MSHEAPSALATDSSALRFPGTVVAGNRGSRVGKVPVLTTVGTGSLTNLGISLSRLRSTALRSEAATAVGVLSVLTLAYVGGAAAGAALSVHTTVGPSLLLVPLPILGAVIWLLTSPRSGSPGRR